MQQYHCRLRAAHRNIRSSFIATMKPAILKFHFYGFPAATLIISHRRCISIFPTTRSPRIQFNKFSHSSRCNQLHYTAPLESIFVFPRIIHTHTSLGNFFPQLTQRRFPSANIIRADSRRENGIVYPWALYVWRARALSVLILS